jgi:hypothetical protein
MGITGPVQWCTGLRLQRHQLRRHVAWRTGPIRWCTGPSPYVNNEFSKIIFIIHRTFTVHGLVAHRAISNWRGLANS